MNGGKFILVTLLAVSALTLFCVGNAMAQVSGSCVNCHTMHNSQDGGTMMVDGSATGSAPALVRAGSCFGCHGDIDIKNGDWTNITTATGRTPRINAQNYGTDTLAGGSFYWVQKEGGTSSDATTPDATGHNVLGVSSFDAKLNYLPPGWDPSISGNGVLNQGAETWTQQLTCAGANGCHGNHTVTNDNTTTPVTEDFAAVKGAHHAGDSTIDGSDVGKSYRFLKGIIGKEHVDWEYNASSTPGDHNVYYGKARASEDAVDNQTISYLCAECHGNFHSGSGTGDVDDAGIDNGTWGAPWLRHPTDFDMSKLTAGDYVGYAGYSVLAPVATNDLTSTAAAYADEIVTCVSCHRAHGSPYDDLLRWDYGECGAGTDNAKCGCFVCHTTKDAE